MFYKWYVIERICEHLGDKKLSDLARKLNEKLSEIYSGIEKEKDLKEFEERENALFYFHRTALRLDVSDREKRLYLYEILSDLTTDASLCIACYIHNSKCDECLLAKEDGDCNSEKSLFGQFYNLLERRILTLREEFIE